MRGKLAKQLRKVTGFHPADERDYHLSNAVRKFSFTPGKLPSFVIIGSAVSMGPRRAYQKLKADVLRVKRSGDGWEGRSHA